MEAKYPGKFKFDLRRDSGTSGRLEVTIFFNSTEPKETSGVVVHSKKNGQGYTHQNWTAFEQRVEEAVKAVGSF